ncbi:MAG: hypothetical protein AABX52_02465 [Nanoarchaeota archaeon]
MIQVSNKIHLIQQISTRLIITGQVQDQKLAQEIARRWAFTN